MSEQLENTPVDSDNVQPETDTAADTPVEAKSETPNVETRDGKLYVDGVRVYTRDDTNRIASNAKKEAESRILQDLEVDSFDKVKSVVSQLRDTEETGLDVQSLRDAVKKREQTVEELRSELEQLKTSYTLRDHISTLKDNMPTSWSSEQKQAVVDLMNARQMLQLDNNTFHIRNGEDFITTDGETPDYATAVKMVGQTLGLPFAKKGVENYDVDRVPESSKSSAKLSEDRLKADPAYRTAYIKLRDSNRSLARSEITDSMVQNYMKKLGL